MNTSIELLGNEAMKIAKAIIQNEYDSNQLRWAKDRIWYICKEIGGTETELLSNAKNQLDKGNQ